MKNETNEKNKITYTFDGCNDSNYIELGKRIKAMRSNRGLTQSALSTLINRDRTGLSSYECGKNKPPIDALYEISNALKYNLNITFEDTNGENDKLEKASPITHDFINLFISNISNYEFSTYDYRLVDRVCDTDEQVWSISSINDREAILVSEEGYKVIFETVDSTNERYIPVSISVYKNETRLIQDVVYRDIYNKFSLTDMREISFMIYTCTSTEEMLLSAYTVNSIKEIVNIDRLMVLHYINIMYLKKEFNLSDSDIKLIIDETMSRKKNSLFIDNLTSSTEKETLLQIHYAQTINTIQDFINDGLLDEFIINEIYELSHLYRFKEALYEFLYDANNEYKDHNLFKVEFDDDPHNSEIYRNLLDKIQFIYNYIESKGTNQSQRDILDIMSFVLYGFYREISDNALSDTYHAALCNIVDFEK